MKAFRILGRSIKDASKSIYRNFSLSIASISCIAITLIVVSISIILSYNVDNVTKLIKKDFTIVAFLKKDVSEEQIQNIENELKDSDKIQSYEYQSKKQILESMKKDSDIFNNIMGNWKDEENPLQDTFLIKVNETDEIGQIANKIKRIEGINLVKYGEGMVENVLSIFNVVEKGLIAIVLSLIVVTAFLISNTIKLTIENRKKEIEIMRLVGASNTNIKLPFIIEGLFIGVIGSLIPIIVSIYGYNYLYYHFDGRILNTFLQLVKPQPFIFVVALVLLVIGIFVGMLGSGRAVKKHLKI